VPRAAASCEVPGSVPEARAPGPGPEPLTPGTLAEARGFKVKSLSTLERAELLSPTPQGGRPRRISTWSYSLGPSLPAFRPPDGSPGEETAGGTPGSSPTTVQQEGPSFLPPTRFSRSFGPDAAEPQQHKRYQHLARRKNSTSRYKNMTPLAKKKMESMLENQSTLQRLTRSAPYEFAEATAIILNAVFIACDTERRAALAASDPQAPGVVRGELLLNVLADLFCLVFVTDLVLRMLADGWQFLRTREWLWNLFDIFVVLTAVLESISRWHQFAACSMTGLRTFAGKFSMFRIVRLLRIVRGTRAIRMSRFIRELSIMVYSLTGAMKPLFWSVVLMNTVLLIFAVFFVDGTIVYSVQLGAGDPGSLGDLSGFFETLPQATTSLYMAMSGGVDWNDIWQALKPLSGEYRLVFIIFITFAILALLNVVTAVFVETAVQRSQNDQELRVQQEVERKVDFISSMQRVFEELDTNGSGTLTLEEFERQMQDENVLTFMSTLELDIDQVRTLLTLLDRDQNGEVDIDEFVAGCIRLKGGAKSLDMAILQYQVEWMLHNLASLSQSIYDHFGVGGGAAAPTREPSL